MKPTLRQLEAFAHVYRLGSLTQAAQAMHLTQSAMSVLLQQLEEVLGVRLFDRTSRALRPTAAGHEAYETAQAVLQGVEQLLNDARGLAEKRRGVVHVGVATAVAATVLPGVIATFEQRHPQVRLVIHDVGPEHLIGPVLEQQVEFSIGTPQGRAAGLAFTPLLRDQLSVICTPDAPLAALQAVPWRALGRTPVITVRRGNGIRTLIDNAMLQAGIAFEPRWEVSYLSTALALTARGLGVSVLPAHLVRASGAGGLVTRPLVEPSVPRDLYLITAKDRSLSPAASELVAVFAEALSARDR